MTAIVLTGGKASLVSELYPDLPTPLIPVAGEPFLYWLTQWIKSQGFTHIVYSAGFAADKIDAWANQASSQDTELCLDLVRENRPLGTGGASKLSINRFPSDLVLIVNGDSLLYADIQASIKLLQEDADIDGVILGTRAPNAGRFGRLDIDGDNRLLHFKEKQPGNGLINAGVYLLRKELFEDFESDKELSLEYHCFPHWLEQGKHIQVHITDAPFIDIGSPEALNKAHEQIEKYRADILQPAKLAAM